MARRGRIPFKYVDVLRILTPCKGYDNGKTIDAIAQKIYGSNDFRSKAMARQLIGAARKATGIMVFSIKPVGTSERRYCHLIEITEYIKAINDFERHIKGSQKTEKDLEQSKKTVEERKKLEEVRKAKEKKAEETKEVEQKQE